MSKRFGFWSIKYDDGSAQWAWQTRIKRLHFNVSVSNDRFGCVVTPVIRFVKWPK